MTRSPDEPKLCPVCGGVDTHLRFRLRSPYFDEDIKYGICSCSVCGHFFATGPLSPELLDRVYGEFFHATSQQVAGSAASPVQINANRRACQLAKLIGSGRLLDVGAGRGYFVKEAARYFDAQGLDYSNSAITYGHELGVVIKQGDFLYAPYHSGEFDVLTFWDVLASMPDVHGTVARTGQLLKSGGFAVFTVPLAESWARRLTGRHWPLWIPPVNLHYFSRASIQHLFRKHGFQVQSMRAEGKRVALNFLLYKLAASFNIPRLARRLAVLPLTMSIPINLGDILTVVVRKNE